MIYYLYYFILGLFAIGGIMMALGNRLKSKLEKRKNYTKFISYLIIINAILYCIIYIPQRFYLVAVFISMLGMAEILWNSRKTKNYFVGLSAVIVAAVLFYGFINFSLLSQKTILFTFIIVSVFDAFSQVFGQLFGKTHILPKLSPNKTLEGFLGGLFSSLLSAFYLQFIIESSLGFSLTFASGVAICAFVGDLLASYLKRKFGIKDFSKLLPGQGGFLDRFDSLIMASVFVVLFELLIK